MMSTAPYQSSLRRVLHAYVTPYIAAHRRTLPMRSLAVCCSRFLDAYHNVNCDCSVNGEMFVLKTLATSDVQCVFDVGANVGNWTRLACAAFPDAMIHCFELDEDTCRTLDANLTGRKRVIVNCRGLSDAAGQVTFKSYPEASECTSLIDYPHPAASVRKLGVVMTGDEYVEANRLNRVDFVKIDVEGAERNVLAGLQKTISRGAIDVIQFEYGRANILARHLLRDLYAFFSANKYLIGKIYPNHVDFRPYCLTDEDFRGLNYLAVRQSRQDLIARLAGLAARTITDAQHTRTADVP
jgi:FkbM family methyltransferase